MQELGVQPKRSLGQNFLISDRVVDRILEAGDPESFYKTIEIGPGLGALTDRLSSESQNFTVIELDKKFAEYWREQGLDVVEEDALKVSWKEFSWQNGPHLLVSNLPYQISSRLVIDLSLLQESFSRMILMFQKEVALRISAKSGTEDYGLLSVVAQCFWKTRTVAEAGAIDFMPKPNVASRVVGFDRLESFPKNIDPSDFLQFLKLSFANRRKKLLPKLLGFQDKENLQRIFQECGFDSSIRAEKLGPQQFIDLYLALKKEY